MADHQQYCCPGCQRPLPKNMRGPGPQFMRVRQTMNGGDRRDRAQDKLNNRLSPDTTLRPSKWNTPQEPESEPGLPTEMRAKDPTEVRQDLGPKLAAALAKIGTGKATTSGPIDSSDISLIVDTLVKVMKIMVPPERWWNEEIDDHDPEFLFARRNEVESWGTNEAAMNWLDKYGAWKKDHLSDVPRITMISLRSAALRAFRERAPDLKLPPRF